MSKFCTERLAAKNQIIRSLHAELEERLQQIRELRAKLAETERYARSRLRRQQEAVGQIIALQKTVSALEEP